MMRCGRSLSIAAWTLVGSEIRRLDLTVWRPKAGGADMVGLSLETGETTHQIATVKGGDDHGEALQLSVECERFDEVAAEGG